MSIQEVITGKRRWHLQHGDVMRFLRKIPDDAVAMCMFSPPYELVIAESVGNPILAAALSRWGWECDGGVMDFYWTVKQ